MIKEFSSKLKYIRRDFAMHEYILHLVTTRLWLVPRKENLAHKIEIGSNFQFLSLIDFEYSYNALVD